MKLDKGEKITLILTFLVASLFAIPLVVYAGDDCIGNSCNKVVTTKSLESNTSVGGDSSRALALGRSSFDVDISQCMGSTSWDTVLGGKQKLVINWVCLAEFYITNGQPELAAIAICNTEMLDEFESEAECEEAHSFLIDAPLAAVAAVDVEHEREEYENDFHEEQLQLQMEYDQRIAALEEELAAKPQVIERTVIEQRPLLSEEAVESLRIKK